MAVSWGRAEIDVVADGSGLPRQTRAIATRAGRLSGQDFSRAFNRSMNSRFSQNFQRALRPLGRLIQGTIGRLRSMGDAVNFQGLAWENLSHNTRQWTLIIGAVAAGMQNLAVLSSALGAGLVVLGGTLSGLLFGLGATVIAFSNFGGDIEKLPEQVRPAARAFQDLGKEFSALRDAIQIRALSNTEGAWRSLGDTIREITPAFEPLADVINGLVNDLAKNLAPGTESFQILSDLVKNAAPIFDRLVRAAGVLGRALGRAFVRAQPLILNFLGWIETLFGRFDEFTKSKGFDEWLSNADRIFGAFGRLLDATGRMLNDLVTPEAVRRTEEFLDNLSDFMPDLGRLLDMLGRLDIFGLIAQFLADFGEALRPLAGPAAELADGLNRIVSIAIDEWGAQLEGVAEALAPVVQGFSDFIKNIPEDVIRGIASAIGILAAAFVTLKGVNGLANVASALLPVSRGLDSTGRSVRRFDVNKLSKIAGGFALVLSSLLPEDAFSQMDSDFGSLLLNLGGVGAFFGPWGALIGGALALVTSLVQDFVGTINDIGPAFLSVFSGPGFALATNAIQNFVPEEWKNSNNPFENFLYQTKYTFDNFGTLMGLLGDEIARWATVDLPAWLNQTATDWQNTVNSWWESVGTFFTVTIPAVWTDFVNWFAGRFVEMGAQWNAFWSQFGADAVAWWNQITSGIRGWWEGSIAGPFRSWWTDLTNGWNNFWGGLAGAVRSAADTVVSIVNSMLGPIRTAIREVQNFLGLSGQAKSAGAGGRSNSQGFAAGGILNGPRRILAGEAGREAIVPMNRALSQVDPSVRWLSAIAQGKTAHMASGGVVGGGKTVNIDPGAIIVQGVQNPDRVATLVVNRIAERIAS